MKIMKKTVNRPLLSYMIVVMILSVLEFANYIIQYIPVAVFLILGFVRAFTVFKIVDHLNMVKEKISESKDRDYLLNTCKKNYSAAIFSYNALAIICCVDAIVSTVSTIRGFYGYANVFIVFLVIEHILDFVGITNLVVVHTDRLGLFLPLEEIWIFSNIAMVGLVGMACLSMVH
ncbi:hypothetical protein D6853_13700 [Butyrivibrio sp. X503]|uniref:hypothetical protein n=1 Tax=Butyrivibrio sp. X503 TaxID=2364878 RepID=UPI000EA954AD|nr:hypothetical protein [Butyrivibrio sp. X503]RKM54277.1 hypothetical protein D6853_13700 [Butyrivibrio sp. X503]